MGQKSRTITFTLSEDIAQQVDEAAREMGISRSEFVRRKLAGAVALRRYWELSRELCEQAKALGITPEDVPRLVEEVREERAAEEREKAAQSLAVTP